MTGGGFEPVCERNEGADPFYRAVRERAFADAIPISGTFELTCRCNFDCRMCYVHPVSYTHLDVYKRQLRYLLHHQS